MQKINLLLLALALFCGSVHAADTRPLSDFATIVDQLDANVLDTSSANINGSGGALVTVVASLAANSNFCRVWDSTGAFVGVYEGSTLRFISTPGMDGVIRCPMAAAAVVKVRSMEAATISAGKLVIQFLK